MGNLEARVAQAGHVLDHRSQHLEERAVNIAQDRIHLVDHGRDIALDSICNVSHVANVSGAKEDGLDAVAGCVRAVARYALSLNRLAFRLQVVLLTGQQKWTVESATVENTCPCL